MKTIFGKLLITATALMLTYGTANAAAAKKTSNLYAYKGNYSGLLIISASGTSLAGQATAKISANKKKDVGSMNLTSLVSSSGSSIAILENYSFTKRAFTAFLSLGTSGVGAGNVTIGKKTISYTGSVNIGGTVFTIIGTARLSKKSLTITEILTGSGTTLNFIYNLKRQGK